MILIFNRFDAISHLMPYYANTHKSFLLLSNLCSASRRKLSEYYVEFIMHMIKYWKCIDLNSHNLQKCLFIPHDLLTINIGCINEKEFDTFIELITHLKESKNWYFNDHIMHSQIKIKGPVIINAWLIERLHPYIDILKSIDVILITNSPLQIVPLDTTSIWLNVSFETITLSFGIINIYELAIFTYQAVYWLFLI